MLGGRGKGAVTFKRSLNILFWQYTVEMLVVGALQEVLFLYLIFIDTESKTLLGNTVKLFDK